MTINGYRDHALKQAADEIVHEAERAELLHGRGFASPHEFYGVLAEEVYEFMVALHANDLPQMRFEARQIAAVALRFYEATKPDGV